MSDFISKSEFDDAFETALNRKDAGKIHGAGKNAQKITVNGKDAEKITND